MFTAYIIVTVLAAAAYTYAAIADFTRAGWILDNMTRYGVPHSWLSALGALKAAGALGLIAGIAVPLIGVAASTALIVYFVGAFFTTMRARQYPHMPYPIAFLLPAIGTLWLRLAAS
jgi:hypothetical protein